MQETGIQVKATAGTPQLKAAKQFSFKEIKKCTNNFSQANDIR